MAVSLYDVKSSCLSILGEVNDDPLKRKERPFCYCSLKVVIFFVNNSVFEDFFFVRFVNR